MKKFLYKTIIFIFLLISILSCSKQRILYEEQWKLVDTILDNIHPPVFPVNELNILNFGAKQDSTFDSKFAIQSAIDKCSKEGGGKVLIPKGTYFCAGSIFLKSNVNLHLEEEAIINFSTLPKYYLPVVLTRWEGVECFNYSALIYAKDQVNIALTGKGILDGKASENNWWPWKCKKEYGYANGMPSQLDSLSRPSLLSMNNYQAPVQDRIFGDGYYLRPNFFQMINCKNILVEGVTFKDSPMWFIHPVLSENITIRGIMVVGKGSNNDGLDPESCKNVLIENCSFDTGDDCIAIKSGRNADGRRINVPSENIVIRNCKMLDGHGGVVIGSEVSGGCKNVFVDNCEMDSPNLDRAIRIKTSKIRGGVIENIFVKNIKIGEVKEAILKINLKYEPEEIGEINYVPSVRNIYLSNINSTSSKHVLYLDGLENSKIENIIIKDCNFNVVKENNIINNIKNLITDEVYINGKLFNN